MTLFMIFVFRLCDLSFVRVTKDAGGFVLLMFLLKNSLVLSFCWILILCRTVRIWILPSRIGTFCCNRFFRLWYNSLSLKCSILILWYTVSRIFLLTLCWLIVLSPVCRLQLAFIWIKIAKLCICFEFVLRCFEEIITVFYNQSWLKLKKKYKKIFLNVDYSFISFFNHKEHKDLRQA